MTRYGKQILGIGLYAVAAVAALYMYRYSWESGCRFDGKTGTGSLAAARPFDDVAWWASCAALASFVAAAPIGWARTRDARRATTLVGAVVAIPLLFFASSVAVDAGIRACSP